MEESGQGNLDDAANRDELVQLREEVAEVETQLEALREGHAAVQDRLKEVATLKQAVRVRVEKVLADTVQS